MIAALLSVWVLAAPIDDDAIALHGRGVVAFNDGDVGQAMASLLGAKRRLWFSPPTNAALQQLRDMRADRGDGSMWPLRAQLAIDATGVHVVALLLSVTLAATAIVAMLRRRRAWAWVLWLGSVACALSSSWLSFVRAHTPLVVVHRDVDARAAAADTDAWS
jgi:hypothetical protein